MATANVTLKKLISGVVTELYPKSTTSQILDADTQQSLADILADILTSVGTKASSDDLTALQTKFDNLVANAPEAYDTLLEIGTYLTTHQDEYTALLTTVGTKVDKVDGMGLSTNDFTTELMDKLTALYTNTEIDTKLNELSTKIDQIVAGEGVTLDAANVSYSNGDITTVAEALDQLLYVAPTVTNLKPSIATDQEIGSSVSNIVFTWTVNKTVTTQTFDGTSIDASLRTYTYAGPLTANKTFTVTVNDGTNSASASSTISFKNYIYWGVSSTTDSASVLTSEFVLALANKKFGTAKSSIGTISATAGAGEYIFVAIPSSWATSLSFKIGGFDTDFETVGTFSFTNASGYANTYLVVKSGQPNLGSTSMTVI